MMHRRLSSAPDGDSESLEIPSLSWSLHLHHYSGQLELAELRLQ